MALTEYKKKRDFKKTSEPSADAAVEDFKRPIYLIQEHDASRLHYDLRLELDGVLKSFAVPKGPSDDPEVKRLAVQTEDHPLAYAAFHGTIPEGEYGAGTVKIWDRGTYENLKNQSLESQFNSGQVEIDIKGQKVKGAYVIFRTGRGKNWILKKMVEENNGN